MRAIFSIVLVLASSLAFGSSTTLKQVDSIQNSTGGSAISVPSTGSTFVSDTNTITLQNKTISGASNTFSNVPASAISSGQLSVSNGGTGSSSLTTNGMLYGNGTSAIGATSAGSQYQVFQAGASGVPTVGALQLNQSAAVSGQLGVANGGTGASSLTAGSVVVGNGTSAVSLVAPGTSGNVLTSNGSTWTSSALGVGAPALNGSQASPLSITAGGGITLTGISYANIAFIQASSSGTTTVTATPSITACTAAGQITRIVGESATNLVKLQDEASLSGSKLNLNGPWTSGLNAVLTLLCDGNGFWNEVSRSN
jgi:hypothetical protein